MTTGVIAQDAARWWMDAHNGERDEAAFLHWLRADARHAAQYVHLQQLWEQGASVPSARRRRPLHRRVREAATALVLLCALGLFSAYRHVPDDQLRTAAGQIQQATLADGSQVLLSAATRLQVRIDGQHRELQLLQGQAWFKVAADRSRPFHVQTPHGTVTALGTAFDIAVGSTDSVVTVTEHRVQVQAGGSTRTAEAGQQLRFDGRHAAAPQPADGAATAWHQQRLLYVSAPLAEVTAGLDRWHGGRTWVLGRALRRQPVTLIGSTAQAGSSRDQLARQLPVRVLQLAPGVQVWVPRDDRTGEHSGHAAP
ncbi:MAG: Protein FecR [Stenotrophomonas maltophilia]|uniref:Protein FecR n=1 Tax=Stenotrophomonas maltophilia TaxID=40324 RepID=A0A7V8JK32_STEMA|nr:MAG: Protein FecR [Stenotrophomonas maltophilia]